MDCLEEPADGPHEWSAWLLTMTSGPGTPARKSAAIERSTTPRECAGDSGRPLDNGSLLPMSALIRRFSPVGDHDERMSEYEITALVMSEHDAFRRAFADLEEAEDPSSAWRELAARLEVHAVAEERLFYPVLADEADSGAEDGKAAVREHNDIRHAVADVAEQRFGSDPWWEAVRRAQQVNGDHMAEEEREFIPEFKISVDAERRDALGMEWLRLHDKHENAQGLSGEDADPQTIVDTESPL